MKIGLHHFIVLILILHVIWYDTRQEHYYLIRKGIDIKMLSRPRIEPMPIENQRVSAVKNII